MGRIFVMQEKELTVLQKLSERERERESEREREKERAGERKRELNLYWLRLTNSTV